MGRGIGNYINIKHYISMGNLSPSVDSKIAKIDWLIAFSLISLVFILPVAHTTTIRAFFFLSALSLWVIKAYITKKINLKRTPLDYFILLYFITIVISFFTSLKLSSSLETFKGEFLTNTLLFYLIVSNIDEENTVKTLITALLAGSFIMAAYGIADFFLKNGNPFDINYRAGSLHQGYEAYGQYLIIVLPFNLLAISYLKDRYKKIVLSILLALNVFALYLTHTRGAWVAFWAEMIILSVFYMPKKLKIIFIGLLILVPIIGFYSLPEEVIWHGKSGISLKEENINTNTGTIRLVMWKESIKALKENPFKGAGYGKANFRRRFSDKAFAINEQAHNTFVNTAVQLGIQGLVALFLVILAILKVTWKAWSKEKHTFRGIYSLGVFTMTIGFFIACQFAEFFIDDTARMFWIMIGLAVSLHVREEKAEPIKNA